MKLEGWIFLLLSWGFIISFTVFCFYKVLSKTATGRGLAPIAKAKEMM